MCGYEDNHTVKNYSKSEVLLSEQKNIIMVIMLAMEHICYAKFAIHFIQV